MPVMKRSKLQNFIFLLKMWSNVSNGFVLSIEEVDQQRNTLLCELHFKEKHLQRDEKCILQWSMNPVPTVYHQKLLSKPPSLPTQQTIRSLSRKRSFPDEFSAFQQRCIITTFQD